MRPCVADCVDCAWWLQHRAWCDFADRTPPRSHEASDCVLDPRIRLHYEYFQSILENLSRGDRLADAQNRADRISDACRKAATRGVSRKSLDLSVEFPSARRLWRVAPSDGTGLAMMAHGSVGSGRAGVALGTPFSDMVGRLRRRVSLASYFSWGVRSGGWGWWCPERRSTMRGASRRCALRPTVRQGCRPDAEVGWTVLGSSETLPNSHVPSSHSCDPVRCCRLACLQAIHQNTTSPRPNRASLPSISISTTIYTASLRAASASITSIRVQPFYARRSVSAGFFGGMLTFELEQSYHLGSLPDVGPVWLSRGSVAPTWLLIRGLVAYCVE